MREREKDNPSLKESILALHAQDMPNYKISAELGCNRSTVTKVLREKGLSSIPKKKVLSNLEEQILAISDHKPLYVIANELKCSRYSVRAVLVKHGLPIINKPKLKRDATEEEGRKLLELYFGTENKKGMSLNSAASLSGITVTMAKKFLSENNIKMKKRGGQ